MRGAEPRLLVGVLWAGRERDAGISVEVKRNPGKSRHEQCKTAGYRKTKADQRSAVAAVEPGSEHTLRAELQGDSLRVLADGALAWEGRLGLDILSFDGPIGIRSDNVRVLLDLLAPPSNTLPFQGSKPERVNCAIGLSAED